jgi:uncharacterized RDD family membrane protein YckC
VDPFERLTIDTPEQIALELPLAGVGSRFLALAVDTVLQIVAFLGVLLALMVAAFFTGAAWLTGCLAPVVFVLFSFCLYWGYFALFETIWKGQTPGKRTAHIRVIKESGRPINAFEAIARNLVRVVDFLPGLYAVGVVCMLLNRRNRRLGDFVAGTVVVHETPVSDTKPYVDVAPRGAATGAPASTAAAAAAVDSDLAQLAREDLLLIETYLQRRNDLDWLVRDKMAEEIAARVRARAGLADDKSQSPDDFLEAVARRIRENARF